MFDSTLRINVSDNGKHTITSAEEKVYLKQDPSIYITFKDLVHRLKYPNGNAVEGQILGRGSFIMSHLTDLDKETGRGKPGPAWTVGAQAVEVEFDTKDFTYRLVKAAMVCHSLANNHPDAEEYVMEEWLQANICRCTSYEEIRKAIKFVLSSISK